MPHSAQSIAFNFSASCWRLFAVVTCLVLGPAALLVAEESEIDIWETLLKPRYFPDVTLLEGRSIVDLKTPYRAEDAAFTPVSIVSAIRQSSERYIDKMYLFVEKNPQPLVGIFDLTTEVGRADLAMRIRIDQYTNVILVAVLNDGKHHIVKNYVKASGGCSAPLAADFKEAMARIGKMKFRVVDGNARDDLLIGQFLLSHPNITGLQKDQKTHLIRPEHYVKKVVIYQGQKRLMTAETGFSISSDPSFRFFFTKQDDKNIIAEVSDSKGLKWSRSFSLDY
jgi:sulfur-oxidizing protein SoxY